MANATSYGSFVPTTNVWDVQDVYKVPNISPELRELLVRMYQNLNRESIVLNGKDTGIYNTQEFVNSQQWFPNPNLNSRTSTTAVFRPVLRKVINFGALPDTETKSVPHNITMASDTTGAVFGTTFTRIYATASDIADQLYLPIPYASASAVADNIEINVDNTYVNIITAADYSSYTVCYVVLEYLQT